MTTEERVAYLEQTLRKAPVGSARRIWAAAQLAQLNGPVRDGGKDAKTRSAKGGRR